MSVLSPLLGYLLFLLVFAGLVALPLFLFKRNKALKNLEPPERFVLLRQAGDSLRRKMETLWDEVMDTILFGTCAAVFGSVAPTCCSS
jgi:hypothetical protein